MGLEISALLSFDLLRGPLNLAFALWNTYMLDLKVAQPSLEVLEKKKKAPIGMTGLSYQASPRLILKPQCMSMHVSV